MLLPQNLEMLKICGKKIQEERGTIKRAEWEKQEERGTITRAEWEKQEWELLWGQSEKSKRKWELLWGQSERRLWDSAEKDVYVIAKMALFTKCCQIISTFVGSDNNFSVLFKRLNSIPWFWTQVLGLLNFEMLYIFNFEICWTFTRSLMCLALYPV